MESVILKNCLDDYFHRGSTSIRGAFDARVCNLVETVAGAIDEKRYQDAVKAISALDVEAQRIMRSQFSRNVLHAREKEWTGHGINRTFRFWSADQKKNYLLFTVEVCDALRERYLAALGYGSVLSIVRENDLIPHDDDLDIIVSIPRAETPVYRDALVDLHNFLEAKGFLVSGSYLAHRHVGNGKFLLDVFLGLSEENFVSWHPGPRRKICFGEVFPVSTASLYGVECAIPAAPESYLEHVYGKDWRTPVPGWTHDFNPAKYSDWFWPKRV